MTGNVRLLMQAETSWRVHSSKRATWCYLNISRLLLYVCEKHVEHWRCLYRETGDDANKMTATSGIITVIYANLPVRMASRRCALAERPLHLTPLTIMQHELL